MTEEIPDVPPLLIACVIPCFDEPKIDKTIQMLQEQTAYKKGIMEIVISEYNEDPSISCKEILGPKGLLGYRTRIVTSDRRGIAYARHLGIIATAAPVILNFDADSHITPDSGIEQLCMPILQGQVLLTCCDNIFDQSGIMLNEIMNPAGYFFVHGVLNSLNEVQRLPIGAPVLEPGLTFSRDAYDKLGGFNDVTQYEAIILGAKFNIQFGTLKKRHIPNVYVYTSPRRAIAAANQGVLKAYANYGSAIFRDNAQKASVNNAR